MNENKEISLLAIPKDIIETHLSPLLSLKDLSRLARTYKNGNHFRKPLQDAKLTRLLECIAFGQQAEAEKILQANPGLLLQSGTVTDYSGRTFEDITAFQYALWALDRHMWTMILKYLPPIEATKQLHDHVYADKKYKALHGSHYDFVPLIDALQAYTDNFDGWSDDQKTEHWCKKVGGAQRLVPVHVANEYCREDRSLDPEPTFKENNLPQTLTFYNYCTAARAEWFPLVSDAGVGVDLGIIRAGRVGRGAAGGGRWLYALLMASVPDLDVAAITALCKVRTNEFVKLKQQLLNIDLTQEEDLNSKPQEKSSSCVIS